jgi:hypothetical protein
MKNEKPEIPNEILEPRQAFTLFDLFHLVLTLVVAIHAAIITGTAFGGWFGLLAFVISAVVTFVVLAYVIGAFVLFLHRRYSPQSRIGYEAACYVLSHFKRDA